MATDTIHTRRGRPGWRHLHCFLALAAISVAGAARAGNIRTTVDGDLVDFTDVQPLMLHNRVMVPFRGVFEHMNANVEWDENSRTVNAQHGSDNIQLPVNSNYATVNGRQVTLDSPATIYRGRTIVPLRFLSESLGAGVEWLASSQTVEITTANTHPTSASSTGYTVVRMPAGTVIPFSLNERLSSNESSAGDRLTANLDMSSIPNANTPMDRLSANLDSGDVSNYQGMSRGAILQGHVDLARAKNGNTPGVLGLAFDRVKMVDGRTYPIQGTLIGLDSNSVGNENGRWVAKPGANKPNMKYIGYGAGGGAILAILTKGNLLTNALIGGALGFLYGEIKKDPTQSRNVSQEPGTKFGVRLTHELAFRVPTQNYRGTTDNLSR